jgi:hypothetical protein
LRRQQGIDRYATVSLIADEAIAIRIGMPPDLRDHVVAFRRLRAPSREVETVQRLCHDQRRSPLAVGGAFPQVEPAVAHGNLINVFRLEAAEVLERVEPSMERLGRARPEVAPAFVIRPAPWKRCSWRPQAP